MSGMFDHANFNEDFEKVCIRPAANGARIEIENAHDFQAYPLYPGNTFSIHVEKDGRMTFSFPSKEDEE